MFVDDDDLEGLTQAERAEYARLSNIEADRQPSLPMTGPAQNLALLRRRETGSLLAPDIGPAAFVVRLDDGHIHVGIDGLERLSDREVASFAAQLGHLQIQMAEELGHRMAHRQVTRG